MAEDRVTIEPGFRPRSDPTRDRGHTLSWIGAVAMVVAAFIFGALVSLPTPAGDELAAASPTITTPREVDADHPPTAEAPATTLPADEPQNQPLAALDVPLQEMVPEFADTILMLTTPADSFNVIRWRASLPVTEVMLSLDRHESGEGDGWPLGLDASGYRFAQAVSERTVRVHAVSSGSAAWQSGNIGDGLVAVVWHDTEPSRLAWLECPQMTAGTTALATVDFWNEPPTPSILQSIDHDCEQLWLQRWGDWGAVLMSDESPLLVDPAGTVVPFDPESRMLAAGPDGATLWATSNPNGRGETLVARSATGEHRVVIPDLSSDGVPSQASWSPDGAHVALSFGSDWADPGERGLRVMDVANGAVVAEFAEVGATVITMAWSSDGRFLIYESWRPQTGKLVFYDTTTNTTTVIPISEIVDEIRVHDPATLVLPEFSGMARTGLDLGGVSPSSDRGVPPPSGDDSSLDIVRVRLPVDARTAPPDNPRLDFLNTECYEFCHRDAVVINPDDELEGSGIWLAEEPFHVRHGFVNEGEQPLGEDFTVELTVTRRQGPVADDIAYTLNHTYRFSPDYVMRATTAECGPGYLDQVEPQTCEWFVHDFAEGLPPGRYDIWAEWFAPCSAWLDLGFVATCPDPDEVTTEFAGSVNMPFHGEGYEGAPPSFDTD